MEASMMRSVALGCLIVGLLLIPLDTLQAQNGSRPNIVFTSASAPPGTRTPNLLIKSATAARSANPGDPRQLCEFIDCSLLRAVGAVSERWAPEMVLRLRLDRMSEEQQLRFTE